MADSLQNAGPRDCLGRTCLKWGADGELTDVDLNLLMQRLAVVDPEVTALLEHTLAMGPTVPSRNANVLP